MAAFALLPSQQVVVTLNFLDANGAAAQVTNVTLTAPDASLLTIAAPAAGAAGPGSAFDFILAGTGASGTATLTATGSNPDGSLVTGTQDVVLTPAVVTGASQVTFTFGTPTDIVPAASQPLFR